MPNATIKPRASSAARRPRAAAGKAPALHRSTPAEQAGRGPLSRSDWVAAAMDLLVEQGIDAVRVDLLARRLAVTRGSFYWHFRDRDALFDAILADWRQVQTDNVIARYRAQATTAEQVIHDLIELPYRGRAARRAAALELAIRAWACRDLRVNAVVEVVDALRYDYIVHCFVEVGCAPAVARERAFVLYGYQQSEALLFNLGSDADRARRRLFVEKMLLAR